MPPTDLLDGIWAAVPTPFRPDLSLDLPGVARNVRHYRDTLRLTGVFCNGLIGEGWALALDERRRVLEATLDAAADGLRVGVVTTHHSLAETVDLSRHADDCGAHHIVLGRPPGPFTQDELYGYVCTVADAVSRPIVLFDSAAQSGGFTPETIARLAAGSWIAGVKCARGLDAAAMLRLECGESVTVTDPYESNWLPNLLRFGTHGLYADPEPYLFQTGENRPIADCFDAVRTGDLAEAVRRYRRLEPLRRVYGRWIAEPLRHGLAPNAALKRWCARMGLAAGPVRPPLRQLTSADAGRLDAELAAAFDAFLSPPECLPEHPGDPPRQDG